MANVFAQLDGAVLRVLRPGRHAPARRGPLSGTDPRDIACGTVLDLSLLLAYVPKVDVHPVAISNPFLGAGWVPGSQPSGYSNLAFVVSAIQSVYQAWNPWFFRYVPVRPIIGAAIRHAGGGGTVSIYSYGGKHDNSSRALVRSISFAATDQPSMSMWWTPDANWDAAEIIGVETTGSATALPVAIPQGGLCLANVPDGWTATGETVDAFLARNGPSSSSPGFHHQDAFVLGCNLTPSANPGAELIHAGIGCASFAGTFNDFNLFPYYHETMTFDQAWRREFYRDSGLVRHTINAPVIPRLPDVAGGSVLTLAIPGDGASGFLGQWSGVSSGISPARCGRSNVWIGNGMPGGYCQGGSQIRIYCQYTGSPAPTVTIYDDDSGATLWVGSVSNGYTYGTVSWSSRPSADGYRIRARMTGPVTPPFPTVTSLEVWADPVFYPPPWDVPMLDGSAIIHGGRLSSLEVAPPSSYTLRRSVSTATASAALTVSPLFDTWASNGSMSPDGLNFGSMGIWVRFTGVPSGWHTCDGGITTDQSGGMTSSSATFAVPVRSGVIEVAVVGISKTIGATQTYNYTRTARTPSPTSIPVGTATTISIAWGYGWASFTAPSDGTYSFALYDSTTYPGYDWSYTIPEVFVGHDSTFLAWDGEPIGRGSLAYQDAAPAWGGDTPPATGRGAWVVGSIPTGAWTGHAGEIAYGGTPHTSVAADWNFISPMEGDWCTGAPPRVYRGGAWVDPSRVEWVQSLAAGETIYLRAAARHTGRNEPPWGVPTADAAWTVLAKLL